MKKYLIPAILILGLFTNNIFAQSTPKGLEKDPKMDEWQKEMNRAKQDLNAIFDRMTKMGTVLKSQIDSNFVKDFGITDIEKNYQNVNPDSMDIQQMFKIMEGPLSKMMTMDFNKFNDIISELRGMETFPLGEEGEMPTPTPNPQENTAPTQPNAKKEVKRKYKDL